MVDTSWEKSSGWYNSIVGSEGQYYHQKVVIPGVLKLLSMISGDSLLDLACGQGILGRSIGLGMEYQGLDLSPSLIAFAQKMDHEEGHTYKVADITKRLPIYKQDFSHAACVLALQNTAAPENVFNNASNHLRAGGKFVVVLNHPCFRIPQNSSWIANQEQRIQSRKINRYMSELKIPITTNPGQKNSELTWSFHRSLTDYSKMIYQAGMVIELIEEWVSDKKSTGAMAAMEDMARREIPLFMAIVCRKLS